MSKDVFGIPLKLAGTSSASIDGTIVSAASLESAANVNTGTDDPLYTYNLEANTFLYRLDNMRIRVWGTTAANGNSKTIKLIFGATTPLTITTSTSGVNWDADVIIAYAGADGGHATGEANALFKFASRGQAGTAVTTGYTNSDDNPGKSIAIKVTGNSSSASDITVYGAEIKFTRRPIELDIA